jgi:cytochrome P450
LTTSKVSFDPFSDDFFNAPFATYRRMRDEAPVYYNEIYDFYALTRHEDVTEALKDHQTYSSSRGIDLAMVQSGQPVPPLIIMMDPPAHRRMRSLVNKVFTPRAIERQRQTVIDTSARTCGCCSTSSWPGSTATSRCPRRASRPVSRPG